MVDSLSEQGRVLEYRKTAKQLYWLAILGLFLTELIIVRLKVSSFTEEAFYSDLFQLIVASGLPVSIFIRLHFFVRPRLFSKYQLLPDRLLVQFKSKVHELHFSQVEKVKISLLSPRFLGGFSMYFRTGQKIVVLSILEKGHEILDQLYQMRPDLLEEQKLKQYLRMSQIVDVSWERIRHKVGRWKALVVKYLVFPFLLSAGVFFVGLSRDFWQPQRDDFLLVLGGVYLAVLIFAALLNHIEERIVNQRVLLLSSNGQLHRDQSFEARVEAAISVVFYFLTLSAALFYLYFKWT